MCGGVGNHSIIRVIYGYLAFRGEGLQGRDEKQERTFKMKRIVAAVLTASMLAACSSTSQPMVDTKGVEQSRYSQDN